MMTLNDLEHLCMDQPALTRLEAEIIPGHPIPVIAVDDEGELLLGYRDGPPVSIGYAYARITGTDELLRVKGVHSRWQVRGCHERPALVTPDPYTHWNAIVLEIVGGVEHREFDTPVVKTVVSHRPATSAARISEWH